MRRGRNRRMRTYFRTAIAIAIVVVLLFPLAWVVLSSFQPSDAFYDSTPSLWPKSFTLENYAVFGAQLRPLVTTIAVAGFAAAFALLIGIPAAYALATFEWKWTALVLFFILLTQVVPSVMLATPVYLIFSKLGLLNSIFGLVIANDAAAVPFTILILTAFMKDLPRELREAAYLDGAGEWRTLVSVVLPPSRTAIVAAGLFGFLFAWGDLIWSLTLNTNGTIVPISLSLFQYFNTHFIYWGAVMATASIALVPAIILLVVAQRYIAVGLTAGSVKG